MNLDCAPRGIEKVEGVGIVEIRLGDLEALVLLDGRLIH